MKKKHQIVVHVPLPCCIDCFNGNNGVCSVILI